jgi:hypothetical protein
MTTPQTHISFVDLARNVLDKQNKPMSVDEIWDIAEQTGLVSQLQTTGKTPKNTLGARLYTEAKKPGGIFEKLGFPAKFILRSVAKTIPKTTLEQLSKAPVSPAKETSYNERELHPVVVRFADARFAARCKTVFHEESIKSGPKHNEWDHPDIVGCTLTTEEWDTSVVHLAQTAGVITAKLYSFELKINLDFSTLRASFFQAVSNSSWAHEGYLIAPEIDGDQYFRDVLKRLSQSFGIGVIELDLQSPDESEILYPARPNPKPDWETINHLVKLNKGFAAFVSSVEKSIKINEIAEKGFDDLYDDSKLAEYLKRFAQKQPLL